jgi:VCBS repeat-containing protein
VFSGNLSDYTITAVDPFTVRVVDDRGIDSTATGDLLSRVELFQFADGTRTFRELTNVGPQITTNGGAPLALPVNENIAAGTEVFDVDANDANALDTLAWSIASGNAQGLFAIDPATGVITLAASPSYEALAALGATSQVLTVAVSDGLVTDTQQITVNIVNVNEAPVVGPTTLAASGEDLVRVITMAELLANATDQDAGATLTVQGLTASSGTLLANPDGSWTFIPAENNDTSVTFSYTVSDGVLGTAATATLDLVGANDVMGTVGNNNLSRPGNFNDQFHGLAGADTITANRGDDTLFGGQGGDSVHGGGGDDLFVAAIADGSDTYNGGAGTDTYDLSRIAANVTVNLTLSFSQSSATGVDSLTSIENVTGGRGNNTITGSNVANVLDGGWGTTTSAAEAAPIPSSAPGATTRSTAARAPTSSPAAPGQTGTSAAATPPGRCPSLRATQPRPATASRTSSRASTGSACSRSTPTARARLTRPTTRSSSEARVRSRTPASRPRCATALRRSAASTTRSSRAP